MKTGLLFFAAGMALLLSACAGRTDYQEVNSSSVVDASDEIVDTQSATDENGFDKTTTNSLASDNTMKTTTTAKVSKTTNKKNENQADGGDMFGTTTQAASGASSTTTQAIVDTSATTTQQTTTLKPAEPTKVDNVLLPSTGYDPDGKGRIQVGAVSVSGQTVFLQLKNVTTKWMTEETSYLEYACFDRDGKELLKAQWAFGALEAGKEKTGEFALPANTVEVKITGFKATYWTQWK